MAVELLSNWIRLREKEEEIYAYGMMGVSFKGKFFKYLKNEVSSEIPAIKEIIDHMVEIGGMSPSVFADVLMNYHKFDIRDDRIRLFISIHYLGQNRYRLDSEPIRPMNLYNR